MATATLDYPETLTTPSPETLTETPAHFVEWLTQKNPTDFVGDCHSAGECPLAEWLTGVYGRAYVGNRAYHLGGDGWMKSPDWMVRFVEAVDALDPDDRYLSVTAQQCLDILNSL